MTLVLAIVPYKVSSGRLRNISRLHDVMFTNVATAQSYGMRVASVL